MDEGPRRSGRKRMERVPHNAQSEPTKQRKKVYKTPEDDEEEIPVPPKPKGVSLYLYNICYC
jgi:hypothetical protein